MKKIAVLIFGGILMASCSSESLTDGLSEKISDEDNLIQVNSKISQYSKGLGDSQLAAGQEVAFFVVDEKGKFLYTNETLTSREDQSFTYSKKMYYPNEGGPVNFLAIHPKTQGGSLGTGIYWTYKNRFTVQTDQSKDKAYSDSDLMTAFVKDQFSNPNATVSLAFKHKLSKIEINIHNFSGNLQTLANFKIKGSASIDYKIDSYGNVVLENPSQNRSDITPNGAEAVQSNYINNISAVIVPETNYKGNNFIQFTLDGKQYSHALKEDITFESGKKYVYNISVNDDTYNQITVKALVEDWVVGKEENIEFGN